MTEQDFHSLSKGVFVIPFNPQNEAGPSRPQRPLQKVYEATYDHLQDAYQEYEKERTESQLDDIADWLDRCNVPPLLRRTVPITRLPLAIIQNISESLPPLLPSILPRCHTLQAREAMDLPAAMRNIAVGFAGDSALVKGSGRTGMDEVESWYSKQKDRSPLLLHIQSAQLIPPTVLSELIYIIAIHPKVPFRVLLSVSSTSTFLSSFAYVEPSLIDISIFQAGRGRKKGGPVNAILKAGSDVKSTPFALSDELSEGLKASEHMTGGGAAATLKALKWSLLHHSINSPIPQISESPDDLQRLQSIVQAVRNGASDGLPGKELLEIGRHPDLGSTTDPAPRISILRALGQPGEYIPPDLLGDASHPPGTASNEQQTPTKGAPHSASSPPRSSKRSRKRVIKSPSPVVAVDEADTDDVQGGDLKELETLFNLWKSAGRNVNLWDWLQGFRKSIHEAGAEHKDDESANGGADEDEDGANPRRTKRKRPEGENDEEREEGDRDQDGEQEHEHEHEQDRLHASFIRFCEEARMLGLVRARGRGRRADEVVKGIGMV